MRFPHQLPVRIQQRSGVSLWSAWSVLTVPSLLSRTLSVVRQQGDGIESLTSSQTDCGAWGQSSRAEEKERIDDDETDYQ
jgi:hypothetical protein